MKGNPTKSSSRFGKKMSIDEQDQAIGRLFRERGETIRQKKAVVSELISIKDKLQPLLSRLPQLDSRKFQYEASSLPDLGLSRIQELLEEREAYERKLQEYNARLKDLGFTG